MRGKIRLDPRDGPALRNLSAGASYLKTSTKNATDRHCTRDARETTTKAGRRERFAARFASRSIPSCDQSMKTRFVRLALVLLALLTVASPTALRASTLYAKGRVSGTIFNLVSRQYLEASLSGSGVVRPDGDAGSATGRVVTFPGQRRPQDSVLGLYRVRVLGTVRSSGETEPVSETAILDVNRRSIVIRGYGRVDLDAPINPRQKGRQRFHGEVTLVIAGVYD